jgi:hypothetical protein
MEVVREMNAPSRPTKPFAWSYSSLKNFETCERRHQQVDRLKNFKEEESEQLRWGHQLHAAMAKAITDGVELPRTMRRFQTYVDLANKHGAKGTILTEQKLAFDRQFQPVGYFDNAAWFRSVIDVALIKPPLAILWDWKTGKVLEDLVQLGLSASMIFAHHPEVTQAVTSYIWLTNDALTNEKWTPEQMPRLWNDILPRVKRMEDAYYTGQYSPNPSGLCKKYCPVETCEYHRVGSH